MEKNSVGTENHRTIQIWEVSKHRLASMHQKMSEPPKLLREAAGRSSCCIFRVPQSLLEINGKSYQPHVVSVGPYHRGESHLKMIEEHKWRYLGSLLSRITSQNGLGLVDLLKAVQRLETRARECYSETIHLDTDEFVEMLVLDGCFIIELFRKVGRVVPVEHDDPLFSMSWVISFFLRDLIRLENQLPFFVLECLFDLSKRPGEEGINSKSLAALALEFFNNALQRPDEVIQRFHHLEGKHLLDLLRSSFIDIPYEKQARQPNPPGHIIQCISKLRRAGIKLKPGKPGDSFLTINFKHGVIQMPTITIDDFMRSFLLNCVAFEQCHKNCSTHMTTYATLLDYLVNTARDVEYLCDQNIIENYFGTDEQVAEFINDLGADVTLDINNCYLAKVFDQVHEYYKSSWHVQWASFKYTYFNTPWSFISAFTALILLLLTFAQTFYTIYAYFRPR